MSYRKFLKLIKLLYVPAYWKALRFGVGAAIEHEKILGLLHCDLVLDVGANRGQFALVARRAFANAKIMCFEPLSGPRELLNQVVAGDANLTVYPYAIGSQNEERSIHVSARDDSSSLLPISSNQVALFPGTEQVGLEAIEVRKLGDFVSKSALSGIKTLLKIDVQGFEYEVLEGCRDILPRIEFIYVECSFRELYTGQKLITEIVRMLDVEGYLIEGIFNTQYASDGGAIQADFLFRRK